jgi:hypothetical protein
MPTQSGRGQPRSQSQNSHMPKLLFTSTRFGDSYAARKTLVDCGIACLGPLGRRSASYGPTSARRAVAQRAKAELPQTGGLRIETEGRSFKEVKGLKRLVRP